MIRAARVAGAAFVAVTAACASLTELSPGIAFLEIRGPSPAQVIIGTPVTLTAVALDAKSAPVAATFEWTTPDTALVSVNRTTGVVTGRVAGGTARIQATTGTLASPFFSLTVVAAAAP